MEVKRQILKITELEPNKGQITGLPKNPRFIKDYRYKELVESIRNSPEFLELRELIVFPYKSKFVVICGNQRLEALRELKYKETTGKILPDETSVEKLKEYAIKDNISFGMADWDALANEWDENKLIEWGMEMPFYDKEKIDEINAQSEFLGLPEFEAGESAFKMVINFESELDRDNFVEKYKIQITKKFTGIWSTWWPFKEREDKKSIKYEN